MISRIQAYAFLDKLVAGFNHDLASNPRFGRMIWVVGYILICYCIVGLGDVAHSLGQSADAKRSELFRLSAGVNESVNVWKERRDQELASQSQLLTYCWQAANARLASADMQTTLQRINSAYSVKNARLSLSEPEQISMGSVKVWQIRAQVRGRIGQDRMPSLVNALESPDTPFSISEMRFAEQRGSGELDLTLSACFSEGQPNE